MLNFNFENTINSGHKVIPDKSFCDPEKCMLIFKCE